MSVIAVMKLDAKIFLQMEERLRSPCIENEKSENILAPGIEKPLLFLIDPLFG